MALEFFAGCVGGAAGILVGHPLDTVKVKIQTDCPVNPKYKGTFHCLSSIVKQESAAGLYKGITSPLYGVGAMNALFFGVYGLLTPIVRDHGNNALWAHFTAGATAGAIQSVIAAPTELAKIRMQLSEAAVEGSVKATSAGKGPSTWGVIKETYVREGLRKGVFKGWCVTLAREIPGLGTYIATYEAMTAKRGADITTPEMLLAGGLAGVASWIACFPMDVVKTRYQSDMGGKYSSAIDCFRKTISTEGYKALFRGLNSTVIRAFPTNAATFAAVAWVHKLAHKLSASEEPTFVDLENIFKLPTVTAGVEAQLASLFQHRLPSYNFMASANSCPLLPTSNLDQGNFWSHMVADNYSLPVSAGAEVVGPDSTIGSAVQETPAVAPPPPSVIHYVPSSSLIVAAPTPPELVSGSEHVVCQHQKQNSSDSSLPLRQAVGKILDRVKKEIMQVQAAAAAQDKGITLLSLVLEWLVRTGASLNVCKCFVDALDHCVCFQR